MSTKGNTDGAADDAPTEEPVVTPDPTPTEAPEPDATEDPKPDDKPADKSLLSPDDPEGEEPEEKDADSEEDPDDGSGAPEEYADFSMPEGVELSAESLEKFTPLAKELGLSQEKAQQLIDLASEAVSDQLAATEKALLDDRAKWVAEVKAMPDYEKKLADAKFALNRFTDGDDEAAALLQGSWIGDHPAVIRVLSRIGSVFREDGFTGSSSGTPTSTRSAKTLYPNSNMND